MRNKLFGVAIDIGTTEIKGSLLDMQSKSELAAGSVPNEQRGFGPDVITRLQFAVTKKEGLRELNRRTVSAINKLLDKLAKEASVDKEKIQKIIAVGNSVMYHLVLMVRPDSLALAPFLPAETKTQEKDANEMGIRIAKGGTFKFLPNISGFVGSDTLAVILLTKIHRNKRYSLIMDIGTNGEIALGSKDKILVA
ncbi:MAG: ferredoxin, partial [Candidatus Omnitrophica bacterium]|nr:ferredoxin [Candidatus Omnitrophota bacterium]